MTDQKPRDHLRAYMKSKRIRQADFAASMGISQTYLSDLICGRSTPSLRVAFLIEDATKRHVRARSWLNAEGEQ